MERKKSSQENDDAYVLKMRLRDYKNMLWCSEGFFLGLEGENVDMERWKQE
jgi:hypothetical protein